MAYLGTKPQSGFISQEANQYFTGLTQNYIDLNQSISSLSSVIILVNGVVQENSTMSLTSSTRITLGDTLVSADKVTCIYVAKISSTQAPATGTVTNDMLAGSIANSKLANSSVSINGSSVSLGGSLTGIGEDNTPYFRAVGSGTQSVATATMTTIVFDSEQLDSDNGYNPSNYKYTIPSGKGGLWFFQTSVYSGTLSDGVQADLMIYKNSTEVGFSRMKMGGSINPSMITGLIANVAAGDALYARFNHYQGSNVTIQPNLDSAYFAGFRIKAI